MAAVPDVKSGAVNADGKNAGSTPNPVSSCRSGEHEIRESRHPDGQLRWRKNFVDDKEHGVSEYWHANGQLRWRENFVDGKLHGVSEEWYDNGQLYWRANYVDGELHGVFEMWSEDGNALPPKFYAHGEIITKDGYYVRIAALGAVITAAANLEERGLGTIVAEYSDLL